MTVIFTCRKWVLEVEQSNYGYRRLEIDPPGGQGHAWTVELLERVGGNIPALM
jgi:hypothetical protein